MVMLKILKSNGLIISFFNRNNFPLFVTLCHSQQLESSLCEIRITLPHNRQTINYQNLGYNAVQKSGRVLIMTPISTQFIIL